MLKPHHYRLNKLYTGQTKLRPGRDSGLAGGFGELDLAGSHAAALVRQRALTVRIDAGVCALFDRRAFGFLEALDASTHDKNWEGVNHARPSRMRQP